MKYPPEATPPPVASLDSFQAREEIIQRQLGDELVLHDPASETTFVLNETAALLWSLCDGSHSLLDMTGAVCSRYDIRSDQAMADFERILGELEALRLVTRVAKGTGRGERSGPP